MAGRRRGAAREAARGNASRRETRAASRSTRSTARDEPVPQVYREMLAEAGVGSSRMTSDAPERPLKRPRSGRRPEEIRAEAARRAESSEYPDPSALNPKQSKISSGDEEDDEDEDIEFEDVEIPKPTVQTAYLSSDEESEEEDDILFEDIDIDAVAARQEQVDEGASRETDTLQLNLTAAKESMTPLKRKRQPLTKEDKERRILIHRMHLLLLLAIVEKRNYWCNDPVVQATLRPLLPSKTIKFLNPGPNLTQFGKTESLKRGLSEAAELFRERFRITEIGMRRALWAEDEADLKNIELPKNIDKCLAKKDFRKAARTLKGSRDVGAMLFCALLRAVGVEVRLVCSLQPLAFVPGGPMLPKRRKVHTPYKPVPPPPAPEPTPAPSSSMFPSPIRTRLGHPNATAYNIPDITPPQIVEWTSPRQRGADSRIVESAFPVFWTEILDIGHQKWQPVDAVVTGTQFKPHRLEPPAADRENSLTYVVAFEEDGAAKDVTRRYAKAFTAKTRRFRIDGPLVPSPVEGAKWWRKALKRYRPGGPPSDLDQIEATELNAAEAREPMPRNVADFKDHPIYALERHLRRHEVLISGATVVGTVGAGSKGRLEKIYRRKDVRLSKSVNNWYRMGREIISGEEPVKVLPKRKTTKRKGRFRHLNDSAESTDEDDPVLGPDPAKGVPLFTFEQTQLYVPPPVVGGRIPKNKFKNLDVYVPSMVPAGGFHFKHPRAGHAAHILGIDYAPALQGFEFKGRQGTAVYNGVVIPVEAVEAVRAVITGLEDLEALIEEERRSRRALDVWRSWMRTLTLRRRLFEGDDYWGDTELGEFEIPPDDEEEDIEEIEGEEEDEPQGGHRRRRPRVGVVLDDDDDEGGGFEAMAGGFEPGGFEPGGFEPGGFEPGGFEPGGFEPGGFEPGGFEPDQPGVGRFESGDFGPGGFEVEDGLEGGGNQRKPPIYVGPAHDMDSAHISGSDGAHDNATQRPGGFEVDDDEEMVDTSSQPADDTTMTEDQEPEAMLPQSESHNANTDQSAADADRDLSMPPVSTDLPKQPVEVDQKVASVNKESPTETETKVEESEDGELDDAPSDVTEELFMDEDGSLIE
ncbi:hypothetical protein N0V93_003143 [Gnomoniopsis smithogilvyi]|uniref:Rad4-domain-containing protein n=1 Tax=Gnomoniopsis smithogilvyi TaxID=1191159 RepID=A0A9W9CYV3_9PEZI|nr:hypothetical protein N0V93_003143 [Gnomoniopsis smithogilvyi]